MALPCDAMIATPLAGSLSLLAADPAPAPTTLWPVLLIAGGATALCVLLHFEALRLMVAGLKRFARSPRVGILSVIFGLLAVHLVEIAIYGVAGALLIHGSGPGVGGLSGDFTGSTLDVFYFSAAVYTTVGFGDITPEGPMRILVCIEALAGLVLITWSASFTFLVMQGYWRDRLGIAGGGE